MTAGRLLIALEFNHTRRYSVVGRHALGLTYWLVRAVERVPIEPMRSAL